eukprot:273334-Pleurochrysis_carterae.AAC.2
MPRMGGRGEQETARRFVLLVGTYSYLKGYEGGKRRSMQLRKSNGKADRSGAGSGNCVQNALAKFQPIKTLQGSELRRLEHDGFWRLLLARDQWATGACSWYTAAV